MDEKIRFEYNPDSDKLLSALKFVNQYVIKTNSILVGGMALDSSLQMKGSHIYDPKITIPDYDFIHYDSVNISYELVSLLISKNYPNVDVVRAVHTTTMRIRVNWYVVADISYIPKDIFDNINTLEFKGMRIIHPGYTMMDQLDSLTRPYVNVPREVVSNRWEKDWFRLHLIHKYYGFTKEITKYPISKEHIIPFCKNFKTLMSDIIQSGSDKINPVITGITGLAFLFNDPKYINNIPISYSDSDDEFKTIDKEFKRVCLMIGDASYSWWKNIKMHSFAKKSKKIIWYNESLSYPYRIEIIFDDYILELTYMNYNCLTFIDTSTDVDKSIKVQPLVGCMWNMANKLLINKVNIYGEVLNHILKTYFFTKEMENKVISVNAINTGHLINSSLRLSLEYFHIMTEKKQLKNITNITMPNNWDGVDKSKINKFDYSNSYYYYSINAKPITSVEFNKTIESLEILSNYLDLKK